MADKLVYNLQDILKDRNTNLKPENLKAGVTCLGVTGTYEGESSGTVEGIKQFNTIEEMNASTGNNDGDIAVIYGISPVVPSSSDEGFEANTLILPDKIPTNIISSDVSIVSVEGDSFDVTFYAEYEESGIQFNTMYNGGGSGIYIYIGTRYGAESEEYYERKYLDSANYGSLFYLNKYYTDYYEKTFEIKKLKVSDENSPLWDYVKFGNISTVEIYHYDEVVGTWKLAPNSMNNDASNLVVGNTMLGGNGLVTGTLDLTSSRKVTTVEAYSSKCFSSTKTDLTISKPDSYISIDTTTLPEESLGDKRWVLAYCSIYGTTSWICNVLSDDCSVLYHSLDASEYDRMLGNKSSDGYTYYINGTLLKGLTPAAVPNFKEMANMAPCTAITSNILNGETMSTYQYGGYHIEYIATNAEIRATDGTVLVPAGPSAATTLKGTCYYNIFGERIDGTYTGEEEIDASL